MEDHQEEFAKIGLNIMFYRKRMGITQDRLAELTSFSRNHIQQIETAKATPSVAALLSIAEALNIPPAKLFNFD